MIQARVLAPGVRVCGQIRPEDVVALAADGVGLIVNNRPDGEEAGQPMGDAIAQAAAQAGVAYLAAPVAGPPDGGTVAAVQAAMTEADGDVLLFCRSGMRSTMVWALGESARGQRDAEEIRALASNAGYDLSRLPL